MILEEQSHHRIDWKKVVRDVNYALIWFQQRQIRPTLRTMFYRLVSLETIPNTEQAYKRLSSVTVDARKSGELPWDSFSDQGRLVLGDFKEEYHTPEQYIQLGINFLRNAPRTYTVPRWYTQPHYVEAWIEKQALANTFSSFLANKEVKIVVNKGYSGWSFLYENCMRLLNIIERSKRQQHQVHVLYFGDFDPSGDDMDRHLEDGFSEFGLDYIDFQRIAISADQIEKFDLPPVPNNQETINKVNHDTRMKGFIKKYGRLYVVEPDALLAVVPDEFRTIVQESVDEFFDEDLYEAVLSKHSTKTVDRLVRQRVRFLSDHNEEAKGRSSEV